MVKRILTEKKEGYDIEAQGIFSDLKNNLKISGLQKIRVINCYDIETITGNQHQEIKKESFYDILLENAYDETIDFKENENVFAMQYLPGQYDQGADFISQWLSVFTLGERPKVRTSKIISAVGKISGDDFCRIKSYLINPVESCEIVLKKPKNLDIHCNAVADVETIDGFIDKNRDELSKFGDDFGLAMDVDDLELCKNYFKNDEKRNPTTTEIKMIDTYWSDHCRHTTFLTTLENVAFQDDITKQVYDQYLNDRKKVYGGVQKNITLMDIATLAMKKLKKEGKLPLLDQSEEINACSIKVDIEVDGKIEEWYVMFKNETHNHPTEIEPFGGAATCLGGAIRDPLSGRAYVYQAMRVTGSGDPRTPIDQTLSGKLAQRAITTTAAKGYSSYGNQIGVPAGLVKEIYHEGFVAKRMELGAVIAAAPKYNVVRETPENGDVVILLGAKTGRDGCGGATGSSKAHTEDSAEICGAEVQKGNPVEERKIQRLFRNPNATRLIKRCNDFGAGGVSVAIGELADGLLINLDNVPTKYDGLSGTELAISESQERMAVVVRRKDADNFISLAQSENLQATAVAEVTDSNRLIISWRGKNIVNISRDFLNTNGAEKRTSAVASKAHCESFFASRKIDDVSRHWLKTLSDINICSQKGLVEQFDSSAGAATVLMPFGGKHQLTPTQVMAAKIPVLKGETNAASVMAYGYNPHLSSESPFHGAIYAVVESLSKLVAAGVDYKNAYLSFQEYFPSLGVDEKRWGMPLAALLGAYHVQTKLKIASIGGKDSMSGSFNDIDVPPTLVSFAVACENSDNIISGEFKKEESRVTVVKIKTDENQLPDLDDLASKYQEVYSLIKQGKVLSAYAVTGGGLCEALSKMCFGNKIGIKLLKIDEKELFYPHFGSIVLELADDAELGKLLGITGGKSISGEGFELSLDTAIKNWQQPLEGVFTTGEGTKSSECERFSYKSNKSVATVKATPKVFIPIFPGTNCEYELTKAFENAGGEVETFVMNNMTVEDVELSIDKMAKYIAASQIVMLSGGAGAVSEPIGSSKFIVSMLKNPKIAEEINRLLYKRDGLMLGIGDGFSALLRLGLVPYGKIQNFDKPYPALTCNTLGRHVSTMVQTTVCSNLSPWLNCTNVGDTHTIAVSSKEARFVATEEEVERLSKNGQIATQYVDLLGNPTCDIKYNPFGSAFAIEGITSPDGRVFGKTGHSERIGKNVAKNIVGEKNQRLFEAGVKYFK
ncbi:MAG: phosphoribosylformylglycinamidine synthase [Firmicutes bacterium]|nr:phosphoribosylformylglycinamidine synthase [Bacillota bacterium]